MKYTMIFNTNIVLTQSLVLSDFSLFLVWIVMGMNNNNSRNGVNEDALIKFEL
jgi:hypothetical protein